MPEENFLKRWSRRKHESARDEAQRAAPAEDKAHPAPTAAPPVPEASRTDAPQSAPALPSIDSLKGLSSEYQDFLRPAVGDDVRRAALKKLFQDPHFNVMDGLDVYIDDYSKADPIPDSMLKTLAHAKRLLFSEKTEEPETSAPAKVEPAPEPQQIGGASPAPTPAPLPEDAKAKS